jgi:uncharacterized protein YfkK (UPF0435 family)
METGTNIFHFVIPLHIYPFDVMISVNEDDDVLVNRLLDDNDREDCEALTNLHDTVKARTVMLPSNQTVIRFKIKDDVDSIIGIIAHEVFHATTFILEKIGMKMKIMTSDEAYAYLIQYLMQEIYNGLKERSPN